MQKLLVILGFGIGCGLFSSLALSENAPPQMITTRHHPEAFINSLQNDPQAGQKVYQQFCATCHAKEPAINLGAPKIGVKADWQPRMKKGIDGLVTVAIAGLNQMPPRGGCFECTDALLKAAILYMLPADKNKK